jgi:hypothetical protein
VSNNPPFSPYQQIGLIEPTVDALTESSRNYRNQKDDSISPNCSASSPRRAIAASDDGLWQISTKILSCGTDGSFTPLNAKPIYLGYARHAQECNDVSLLPNASPYFRYFRAKKAIIALF